MASSQEEGEGKGQRDASKSATADPAFMTEADDAGEGSEEVCVTWGMLAQLLLDSGIVGDAVRAFDVVKVLSHIELNRIAPLHDEFMQQGNNLSVEEFIVTMKRQFNHVFDLTSLFSLHDEERRLHAQLLNLFEMIDIQGSATLAWEDFTAFLVDQGMTDDVAREFNIIRFSRSPIRDDMIHQSHVEKAFYFKHYDKIAFFEQGSKSLKLCTPDLQMHRELRDFTQVPLCAEYIDKYMWLVVSCSDLTLSFYDADNNMRLVRRIQTKTAQNVMCWSEVGSCLFSADHEGRIYAWDLNLVRATTNKTYEPGQGDSWKDFVKKLNQDPPMRHVDIEDRFGTGDAVALSARDNNGRSKKNAEARYNSHGGNIVMMLLELPVLATIASCGVDKNIMIWDVHTGNWKRTLKGHEMGVRCIAFATSSKVLVSGGFDYKLFVWNPYVGNSTGTFPGHTAPIVGIEVLGAASNQVMSADSDGFMRTWDLGTYQCLQSIYVEEIVCLRAFISIPSHKRVMAADREFVAYDYQNTGVADQTDESPIIKAFYNPRRKVFLSGTSTHIRVWDAITGAIKRIIVHRDSEITDFCIDDRAQKVFIADNSGSIHVYNITTGCIIKKLTSHSSEVSGMLYCSGDKTVVTVSWDRTLLIHDESERIAKTWREASNVHNGDITCVAFSRHLGLLATGSTDYVISLREYERLRTVASLLGHKADITALAFVEPFALLVSADIAGFVAIWSVPAPSGKQHKWVNEVLTRFINIQSLESSAAVNCLAPVYEPHYNHSFTLYTGDEDGDVRAWDLSALLVAADLHPCLPKADWDPRKKDHIDCSHAAVALARKAASPEVPELQVRCPEQVVRQIHSWRAHSDSVRTINVHYDPEFILTAGYDFMVKLWTREGELMTILRAYGSTPWSFKARADMAGVDEDMLDDVLQKVQEVEERSKAMAVTSRASPPALQGRAADADAYKRKASSRPAYAGK
eukprot:TRINITY_DN35643_c0_g1_i3.p1 TRINITY_DN35643_c0_g1~~TRINITY_DN35643_c0_g1_i3.p1  ORF type:complete len:1014 (-),score=163.95 TRINITY_DN35643_c0_g1_i3:88-3000(-)